MNENPPKKSPATSINAPQELEQQIRLCAYELYAAGRTVMNSRIGSAQKRRSQ